MLFPIILAVEIIVSHRQFVKNIIEAMREANENSEKKFVRRFFLRL